MSMMIYRLATGDKVHRYNRCLVVPFSGKRKVMSTSMHNGGYREDLTAIFNHDVNPEPGRPCEYCQPGQEDKLKNFIIDELGLDYDTVAYMATIVSMESASIKTLTYDELTVTAIVTASLEVNGGRVGELGTCHEKYGEKINLRPGTINTMVFTNVNMTPGCMSRTIMTATEAKTAALQELIAGSLSSTGIATGSGTDNIMVVANADSDNLLTYAGKHSKLGELIGKTVMSATKESLEIHMGLSADSQHSMLARLKRFKVNDKSFIDKFSSSSMSDKYKISDFIDYIHRIDLNPDIVTLTSLYVHLFDQLIWDLISIEEVKSCGKVLLENIASNINSDTKIESINVNNKEECINIMIEQLIEVINLGIDLNN